MREILFRGKDIVGNWHAGNLAVIKQDFHNGTWTVKAGSYISNECGSPFAYQIRPETVGQFTGLHDKNGAEVYEGDLYTAFGSLLYEIRFVNGSFCGGLLGGDDSMFSPLGWASPDDDEDLYIDDELFKIMEVIGNIHDNPELLP